MMRGISILLPRGTLLLKRRYLWLLLLPAFVLLASEYVLGNFGDTSVVFPDGPITSPAPFLELTNRYHFLSAGFFYTAVAVIFLAVFSAELWTHHSARSVGRILLGCLLLILFIQSFSVKEPAFMGPFEAEQLLGQRLFVEGLQAGQLRACTAWLECGELGAYEMMKFVKGHANLITALAGTAVIAGMLMALARETPPDLTTREGLECEAEVLCAAQNTASKYLYCSGILLSVGMVFMLTWMKWPGALIADEALRAQHGALVEAVSLYRGVSYSVLILSYYMPVSLILMVRIERFHLAVAAAGSPKVEKDVMGFDITRIASLDAAKKIIAIVSPILAGGLGAATQWGGFGF